MQSAPVIAYIALGSNVGDRRGQITAALDKVGSTTGIHLLRASRLLANPAVGGPADSPDFLNAVAEIETILTAREVLHRLLEIEQQLGRQRREKWAPRTIDLDLLLYADSVIASHDLTIPHPLMHTRRFVLEPLAEIAPGLVHPKLKKTVASLLERLSKEEDAAE